MTIELEPKGGKTKIQALLNNANNEDLTKLNNQLAGS
jgi:hypothetical protein